MLRHGAFDRPQSGEDEKILTLPELLERLGAAGRGLKAELREGELVADAAARIQESGFDDSRLWFSGRIEKVRREGFELLAEIFPHAVVQAGIDFLGPLMVAAPDRARDILEMLGGWGVNRFSVKWTNPLVREIVEGVANWDYPVSIEEVTGLEAFLRAVLLLPTSISSDFNFPEWCYYGHGTGPGRGRGQYALRAK